MESTNAQFAKISLAIFDEIASKAQELKQVAHREIGTDDTLDPLAVLQVVKRNLGELRAYIRTVSSPSDDMNSTFNPSSESNSSLNEIHEAINSLKE